VVHIARVFHTSKAGGIHRKNNISDLVFNSLLVREVLESCRVSWSIDRVCCCEVVLLFVFVSVAGNQASAELMATC